MSRALAHLKRLPLVGTAVARLLAMRRPPLYFDGVAVRAGIDVAQGEPFESRPRDAQAVTHIVVHESVTTSGSIAERVLRRKEYGVHVMIEPDGSVTQHNDSSERVIHAGGLNGVALGIEVVNPYYPRHMKQSGAWSRVIPARWAHEKQYVVPPLVQLEALVSVIEAGFVASERGLMAVPREWAGLDGHGRIAMGRIDAPRNVPGVHAHIYSGHADGGFPVLYAYLRMERGMEPSEAYETAIALATNAGQQIRLPS